MFLKHLRRHFLIISTLLLISVCLISGCCKSDVVKVINQATFGKSDNEQAYGIAPLGNNQYAITGTIRDAIMMTGIISGGTPPVLGRLYNFTPRETGYEGSTAGIKTLLNQDGKILTIGNQGSKLPVIYLAGRENDKPEIQGLISQDVIRYQQVKDVIQLRDRSYLLTGYVWKDIDNRQQDVMVTRVSSDLKRVIWSNSFGTSGFDSGEKIIELNDGRIVVFGITNGAGGGSEDILMLQLDLQGSLISNQVMGTPFSDHTPRSVVTNNNSEIYLVFNHDHPDNSDFVVTKMNSLLEIEWSKRYGTPERDLCRTVVQAINGGGIIVGGATVNDNSYATSFDALLARIEGDGRLQWAMAYGGCSVDAINDICHYNSEGYLAIGSAESFANNADIYVFKTDLSGQTFLNDLVLNNVSVNDISLTVNRQFNISNSFLSNSIRNLNILTDNGNLSGATQPTERKPCN